MTRQSNKSGPEQIWAVAMILAVTCWVIIGSRSVDRSCILTGMTALAQVLLGVWNYRRPR